MRMTEKGYGLSYEIEWVCQWILKEQMVPRLCLERLKQTTEWFPAVRRWINDLSHLSPAHPTPIEVADSLSRHRLHLPFLLQYGVAKGLTAEQIYAEPKDLMVPQTQPQDTVATTLQAIYDRVATHLIQQGVRCQGLLMDAAGRKTPLGVCVPDSIYAPWMEESDLPNVVHRTQILGELEPFLLFDLQSCHHAVTPSRWPQRLRAIAKAYGLSDTCSQSHAVRHERRDSDAMSTLPRGTTD